MFFGLEVKSGQAKPIILENTTHLSQAVLEPSKNGKKEPVSLIVEHNKKQFILCVLDPSLSWQCRLDLLFEGGAEIKFTLRGSGTVHLTGYETLDDYDDMNYSITSVSSSEDEDEEDEEKMEASGSKGTPSKLALTNGTGSGKKSARKASARKSKQMADFSKMVENMCSDDDEDDSDFEYDTENGDFELIKQGMVSSSDDDEDDDSDDDDDDDDDDDSASDEEDDEDISDEDDEDDEDGCQIEEMSEDSD